MKVNYDFQTVDDKKKYTVTGQVIDTSMYQKIDVVITSEDDVALRAIWSLNDQIPKIRTWDGKQLGPVPNPSEFSEWRKLLNTIISENAWFTGRCVLLENKHKVFSVRKNRSDDVYHESPEVITEELPPHFDEENTPQSYVDFNEAPPPMEEACFDVIEPED